MSDRIRLCTEIASSIKYLGFKGDLSFHQFLYPVEEETHRLFRFLLDKIASESDVASAHDIYTRLENNLTTFSINGQVYRDEGDLNRLEQQLNTLSSENVKLTHEVMDLNQQLKSSKVEIEVSSKHLEGLIKEKEVYSLAIEMDLDSSDIEESKMLHMKKSLEERLLDSKVKRESILAAPESSRIFLESSNLSKDNELHLQDLKVVRQKIEEITAKLQQRDKQNELLEQKLVKSMKGPTRSSYVSRITELIKNSKKQDAGILRILDETRDLQRDSNANQGRLKRTYALVDELVFRDAKKDATSRQAYRLLTSIHENFASCYDAVFSLDKLHREIAELQVSLEVMERRPVDLKRAEADFEAFISENLCFEKAVEANIQKDSGLK
ncbi:hypothetical protein L7F22_066026 [Adiantum nelumboides]|nr:hypothetical protein [Adiantum nelumboides]